MEKKKKTKYAFLLQNMILIFLVAFFFHCKTCNCLVPTETYKFLTELLLFSCSTQFYVKILNLSYCNTRNEDMWYLKHNLFNSHLSFMTQFNALSKWFQKAKEIFSLLWIFWCLYHWIFFGFFKEYSAILLSFKLSVKKITRF